MTLLAVSLLYMLAYMRIAQAETAAAAVGVEDYSVVVTGEAVCLRMGCVRRRCVHTAPITVV